MDADEKLRQATVLLMQIRAQLREWAGDSVKDGCSTHQVDPQRMLADRIDTQLGRWSLPA